MLWVSLTNNVFFNQFDGKCVIVFNKTTETQLLIVNVL